MQILQCRTKMLVIDVQLVLTKHVRAVALTGGGMIFAFLKGILSQVPSEYKR